ncbi:ras suppressor protein 1-like [Symsagittifera roscoffensis]|uniref:ras suppressor protein 1-like n=1 Tax=Symsagittifera roscoffensis TaxID=84072 RepID=UPI00307BAE75
MSSVKNVMKEQLDKIRKGESKQLMIIDMDVHNMVDIPNTPEFHTMRLSLTKINCAHNKIPEIPASFCTLENLEYLNFTNNKIVALPANLCTIPKLKHLYLGCNRIDTLPKGFGSFPALEVLDLSYNNLREQSLPRNFEMLTATLRALYFADNDFQRIPESICRLSNLETLSFRNNDLIELPNAVSNLKKLKEFFIEGNRLEYLPVGFGELHFDDVNQSILRGKENPWCRSLKDQFLLGQHHVINHIRSDNYNSELSQVLSASARTLPPIPDKSKKASRK